MTNPKRPRDPNQLAKLIADIATGGLVPNWSDVHIIQVLVYKRQKVLKGQVKRDLCTA